MLSVRILFGLFIFYTVALTASIAAMELASWFAFLLFLVTESISIYKTKEWPDYKIGGDWAYWGFWLVLCVGAVVIDTVPTSRVSYIIGEGRWILLLYMFTILLTRHPDWTRKVIPILLVCSFLLGVYSIYQAFTGVDILRSTHEYHKLPEGRIWRVKALFSSTMTYSYSLGMVFFFLVSSLFFQNWRKSKVRFSVTLLVLLVLGTSLVFTFTRGLWAGMAVSIITISFLRKKSLGFFVLSSLIVALGIAFVSTPIVSNRFYGVFMPEKVVLQTEKTRDKSKNHRVDLWKANWAMFKDYPLLGVGHRENQHRVQEYHLKLKGEKAFDGHAHSNFLQILSGTGAFGLFFFLSFMGFIFWSTWRLWKELPEEALWERSLVLGSIGAQICFHVGGLTESSFYDGEVNHMFLFLSSIILALRIRHRKKEIPQSSMA